MRKLLVFLCVFVSTIVSAQQITNGLTASNGVFIGFWEYKPADYAANPSTKYPVIIFLHGIGEIGNGSPTDLAKLTGLALPRFIAQGNPMKFYWNGKWETFIVLSPQLSNAYGDWSNFYVEEMIKHATTTLRGDPNRIFLTGLSLGGGAVWRIGSSLASKLAGIAPVCPTCQGVNWQTIASANLPVWTFHAKDDPVASFNCSLGPVNTINSYNPLVKAKITLWPEGNHWIWDRAYDPAYNWQNPNLYEWFLGQNKLSPANAAPVANAGPDVTIGPGGSVTLNAGSSYDADGGIVKYVWKKMSGPGGGELGSPASAVTSVTGMWNTGIYEYELTVCDARTVTSTDRVSINVVTGGSTTPPPPPPPPPTGTNQAPLAKAGNDATITLPTNSVTLNGGSSSDPDGSILKYEWKQVSGPSTAGIASVNGTSTQVTSLVQGSYTFRLTIWDNKYEPASDDVVINVNAAAAGTNQAPVARAGNDATITLPTNSTTLDASGSSDADGSIIKYEWKQISGPSTAGIASVNGTSTNVTGMVQGTYSFRVTIWDNKYEPASDDVVITVNAAAASTNQAPVARAGNDASVSGSSTTLNGTASSDADGSIIKYQWTQVSGPNTASIASVNGSSTGVSGMVQGTYSFRVTIWDNKYEPASDDVVITVNAAAASTNQAPVARAGNDASVSGSSTSLNGTASSDADGSIIKYQWTQVSGPNTASIASVNGSSTGVSGLVQGTYYFRLTIWDNKYEPSSDDVTITVTATTATNQAPTARAGSDASITLPTNSVTLNGSTSSDADGSIIKYQWTQVSGPSTASIASVNGSSTGVSGMVQGNYYFRLTIWDNKYEPATDDVMIEVKAATTAPPPATGNLAPVSKAGNDISISLPTSSVNLNGAGSYDPDGTIIKYEWRKASGPAGGTITSVNNASTSITGLTQGTYIYVLRIWDNVWLPTEDQVTITVNAAAAAPVPVNQAPVAKAGNDVSLTLPTNWVKLNGGGSYDSDGSIVQYEWRKESGPASFLITNGNTATPIISNMVAGTYTYVLKVWDNQWLPTEDRMVITVNSTATGMASTFTATEASSIVEEPLSVSPNPAVSYIVLKMVSATMGSTVVNIYDVNGRVVKQVNYNKSAALFQQQIDISSLQAGTYTAEVIINNTKKSSSKFIKQ